LERLAALVIERNQLVSTASGIPEAVGRDRGVALELFELGPPELPDVDLCALGWTYFPEVPVFNRITLLVTGTEIA
jgi:hypothetical protein